MRPIKFRAWDNKKKEMIIQDFADRIDKCLTYYELNKSVELMQFTWLLDKNGKEIYEGDKLRIRYDREIKFATVTFEDGCFCLGGIWYFYRLKSATEYEIIWNIYKNPELLSKI